MIIYFSIIISFGIGAFLEVFLVEKNEKKKLKLIFYIFMLFLLLFFGFRGYVATDWVSYSQFYKEIEPISEVISGGGTNFKSLSIELGFKLYMSFLKMFSSNYNFFVFFNSAIDLYILYMITKKWTKYRVLMLFSYFAFTGTFLHFDILRNAKSIMLFILSIKYLKTRNFSKYFIVNLIGAFFHISALLYLPLYFLLNKKISKKKLIISFIVLNLIYFFNLIDLKKILPLFDCFYSDYVKNKLDIYLSDQHYGAVSKISIQVIEKNMFLIYLIKYYEKLSNKNKDNIIYMNLLFLLIVIFMVSRSFFIISDRVMINIMFTYWFIIPMIMKNIRKISNKLLFLFLICVYCFRLFVVPRYNPDEKSKERLRYDNILFNHKSYEERMKNIILIRSLN